MSTSSETISPATTAPADAPHYYRFHLPHVHLTSTFGEGWFAQRAAYAAPLILLAQTRQADRDKAHSQADAQHREDLAKAAEDRQMLAHQMTEHIMSLLQQNTELTVLIKNLSHRIEGLTVEMHEKVVEGK